MDHLKLYEEFDPLGSIKRYVKKSRADFNTKSFDLEEFRKLLITYSEEELKSYYDRIRFSSRRDFDWGYEDNDFHYSVLFDGDKIIGVCKVGYYKMDGHGEDNRTISFFSIDREYRKMSLTKMLVQELMNLCKEKGFNLGASSWTVNGLNRLRPTIKEYAKKTGVVFHDHERMHDAEWMYRKGINHNEMTPKELKKWNKTRK